MPQSINIAARDWTPGRYERTVDTVPANAIGVRLELDMALWPSGKVGGWEIAYSADGVTFDIVGFGELWKVDNPRNGITAVTISTYFPTGVNLSDARRNPNQVRAAMNVDVLINTPVKLNWLTSA